MSFLIPKTALCSCCLAASLVGQGPNPAMNSNMAWQMQQQNFQAQRMMQMQQQMFRQMQMQQSQIRLQQAMHLQIARQAAAQARLTTQLEQAARLSPNFPPPVLPKPAKEIWQVSLGQSERWPCFDGNHLIGVAAEPLRLQGLDQASGKVTWETPIQGKPELDPVLMGDHLLYVNKDYLLVLMDAATGQAKHQIQLEKLGGFLFSAKAQLPKVLFPVLSEQMLILPIFGKGKEGPVGIVYALDALSGKKLWETQIPGGADLSPVLHGERVLVGGCGRVMALDLKTGKPAWEVWTGAAEPLGGGTLVGDRFCVLSQGKLIGIDARTGEKAWTRPFKGDAILMGEGDRLVHTEKRGFISVKDWVVALDVRTGETSWEQKVGSTRLPWIQAGKVICNAETNLLAMDLGSGKLLWQVDLGAVPQLPFAFSGDAAYAVTKVKDEHRIQAIRLADGTQAWDFFQGGGRSEGLLLPLADGLLFPGEKGSLVALK